MNTDADSLVVARGGLRNHRNIHGCDVELTPLTTLVQPDGTGNSNSLDAIRFAVESLQLWLE